jgi:hypothetical protein
LPVIAGDGCITALFEQHSLTVFRHPVARLAWRGDELVDWLGGCRAFALEGTVQRAERGRGGAPIKVHKRGQMA